MGTSVTVNGRTVVHQRSAGLSLAYPDICLTPPSKVPVPYLNLAISADATATSATVFADGEPVMIQSSSFGKSTGDEAGSDGGIISGCIQGRATFCNYSYDVKIEAECVPRQLDPMLHNRNCPANAHSPAELQPTAEIYDRALLCIALCICNELFSGPLRDARMPCFRHLAAEQRWTKCSDTGVEGEEVQDCRHWDPRAPGIYVEVPYDMSKDPPEVVMSEHATSKRWKDKDGNPLPLPAGDLPPLGGTARPDVVTVKDPSRPPERDNIKEVYEVKFPGDSWHRDQAREYKKINNGNYARELNVNVCGCYLSDPEAPRIPVPVPKPVPVPLPKPVPVPLPRPVPLPLPKPVPVPLPKPVPAPVPSPKHPPFPFPQPDFKPDPPPEPEPGHRPTPKEDPDQPNPDHDDPDDPDHDDPDDPDHDDPIPFPLPEWKEEWEKLPVAAKVAYGMAAIILGAAILFGPKPIPL